MTHTRRLRLALALAAALVLHGCGDDTPTEPGTNPENAVGIASLYERTPSATSCDEGVLRMREKQSVVDRINHYRAILGLQPVTYDATFDVHVQRAAFMSARNRDLSHEPPSSWTCWSQEGDQASAESNLWLGSSTHTDSTRRPAHTSASIVDDFINDSGVESLGHRRWLISPFLRSVSFGRADIRSGATLHTGGAIRVFNQGDASSPPVAVGPVAYPKGDFPRSGFNPLWYHSLTLIIDGRNPWENSKVDYSIATVSIVDEGGVNIAVTDIRHDNIGYGVPNALQWKATAVQVGRRYTVTVSGVRAHDVLVDPITWSFRITQTI